MKAIQRDFVEAPVQKILPLLRLNRVDGRDKPGHDD